MMYSTHLKPFKVVPMWKLSCIQLIALLTSVSRCSQHSLYSYFGHTKPSIGNCLKPQNCGQRVMDWRPPLNGMRS